MFNTPAYNNFDGLQYIPYNILVYLANDPKAEDIWKILKYPTSDCLSKPNLTYKEKMALIWKGEDRQERFNIFTTFLVGNMELESKTILKIYQYDLIPNSRLEAKVLYAFDMMIGHKIAIIYDDGIPVNRAECLCAKILSCLNGVDVGGGSLISFDKSMINMSQATFNIGNNSTFTGISLRCGLKYSNTKEDMC